MSAKRAKPESKAVEKKAAAQVFNILHLVAFICTFVPNTQLPNVKRANNATKLAFTNAALDERRKRGVLEKYVRLDWIRDRALHLEQNNKADSDFVSFTVCFDCKGFLKSVIGTHSAEYFSTTPAKNMKCHPCEMLARVLAVPLMHTSWDLERECELYRSDFDLGSVPSAEQRKRVEEEERYDPVKHLAYLRKRFPYTPSYDEDEEEDEEEDGDCAGGTGECWGNGGTCAECGRRACSEHLVEHDSGEGAVAACSSCAESFADTDDEDDIGENAERFLLSEDPANDV